MENIEEVTDEGRQGLGNLRSASGRNLLKRKEMVIVSTATATFFACNKSDCGEDVNC